MKTQKDSFIDLCLIVTNKSDDLAILHFTSLYIPDVWPILNNIYNLDSRKGSLTIWEVINEKLTLFNFFSHEIILIEKFKKLIQGITDKFSELTVFYLYAYAIDQFFSPVHDKDILNPIYNKLSITDFLIKHFELKTEISILREKESEIQEKIEKTEFSPAHSVFVSEIAKIQHKIETLTKLL